MQVDPLKFTLKAPGTKRLKLIYDGPFSNFAFKFILRRCSKDLCDTPCKVTTVSPGQGRVLKTNTRPRLNQQVTDIKHSTEVESTGYCKQAGRIDEPRQRVCMGIHPEGWNS